MLLATNQQEKMPVSNQRTLVIEICLLENDFCLPFVLSLYGTELS